MKPFKELPKGYPFPDLEQEIIKFWKERGIFKKTLSKESPQGEWVFYEGPPTANNKPHVGHVLTRVVKDLFPRFKTMRGFRVERQAGWDTHGLPVEIEIEKKLGISTKKEIEEFGIEKFNRLCLESVHIYEREWRVMSERVGFWIDMENAYFTYHSRYIESIWWALKELFKRGLLFKDYKIQPYCARCGTTLSSHEVAQNYKETEDPSLWLLFPLLAGQKIETTTGETFPVENNVYLLAWTTTPWTLLAHVGLAVSPEFTYKAVKMDDDKIVIFADKLLNEVPALEYKEGKAVKIDLRDKTPLFFTKGEKLVGLRYKRPFNTVHAPVNESYFNPPPSDDSGWCVFPAEYVSLENGSGIVHTAPPFGDDDFRSGKQFGLPFILTIDEEGRVKNLSGIERFSGLWFKDADKPIVKELRERKLVLFFGSYLHSYPFCWRCEQPLIYLASENWFIKTSSKKEDLIEKNKQINWIPQHIKEGRFGRWLENIVDWAISRKRYWGTPIPVWSCQKCGTVEVIGSFKELFEKSGQPIPSDPYDNNQFDPHRPMVDRFKWRCSCGGTFERIPEVLDAWFDSGAMPFAHLHYPFENRDKFTKRFPADFISEAVDQTRGWFYTLHALAVTLFNSPAYKNCVVLGHVNDEKGRKMSKRLGNVVDPMEVIKETGADALRWYFYLNNPTLPSRFSARLVKDAAQSYLIPLWNSISFFTIYANIDGWEPGGKETIPLEERNTLDKWIVYKLKTLRDRVTDHLESFNLSSAAKEINDFLDDLTNWYIRRSRERFWASVEEGGKEKESAYQTLYYVLSTLAKIIAPFTPFIAEYIYQHLQVDKVEKVESVHLADWPTVRVEMEQSLVEGMDLIKKVCKYARAARQQAKIKIRQPIEKITVITSDSSLDKFITEYSHLIKEEVNVLKVEIAHNKEKFVNIKVKPNFRSLGPKLGKKLRVLQNFLTSIKGEDLIDALEKEGELKVDIEGEEIKFSEKDLEIAIEPKSKTVSLEGDSRVIVLIDTRITPELLEMGVAREIIHFIQQERKRKNLEYTQRIKIKWYTPDGTKIADVIKKFSDWIKKETLAIDIVHSKSAKELKFGTPLGEINISIEQI